MDISAKPYLHKVQYYETDKMGIVHHSNYFRWFEEARTAFLEDIGMGYDVIEEKEVIIPVLDASCKFKASVGYGSTVAVFLNVKAYNGVKLAMEYKVMSEDLSVLHALGETAHCFLNKDFRPVNIKKYKPEIAEILDRLIPKE